MKDKDYKVTIERTYLTDGYVDKETVWFESKKRAIKFANKRDSYYSKLSDSSPLENAFSFTITVEEIKLIKVVCK